MLIEVTEDDIKLGWKWSYIRLWQSGQDFLEVKRCQECPVAIALNRQTGKKCVAETYRLTVGKQVFRTPEVVSDWMYDFDKGFTMKPFSFDIEGL